MNYYWKIKSISSKVQYLLESLILRLKSLKRNFKAKAEAGLHLVVKVMINRKKTTKKKQMISILIYQSPKLKRRKSYLLP